MRKFDAHKKYVFYWILCSNPLQTSTVYAPHFSNVWLAHKNTLAWILNWKVNYHKISRAAGSQQGAVTNRRSSFKKQWSNKMPLVNIWQPVVELLHVGQIYWVWHHNCIWSNNITATERIFMPKETINMMFKRKKISPIHPPSSGTPFHHQLETLRPSVHSSVA